MFQEMLQVGGSGGGLNWTKIGESTEKKIIRVVMVQAVLHLRNR